MATTVKYLRIIASARNFDVDVRIGAEQEGVAYVWLRGAADETAAREAAAKATLRALGWDERIEWNEHAGCKCGCSPGFLLHYSTPKADIYITEAA